MPKEMAKEMATSNGNNSTKDNVTAKPAIKTNATKPIAKKMDSAKVRETAKERVRAEEKATAKEKGKARAAAMAVATATAKAAVE